MNFLFLNWYEANKNPTILQIVLKITKTSILTVRPAMRNDWLPRHCPVKEEFSQSTYQRITYWKSWNSNFEKREITKSYSGLERDDRKPRRVSFLNYFWTSSIHRVSFCNCYFNFDLRNPRKAYTVSEPQEEKYLLPVDQP